MHCVQKQTTFRIHFDFHAVVTHVAGPFLAVFDELHAVLLELRVNQVVELALIAVALAGNRDGGNTAPLRAADDAEPPAAAARRLTIKGLQNRISVLAILIIILSVAGVLAWYQLSQRKAGFENRMEDYANQYSP